MKEMAGFNPLVSIIIVTYNSEKYIFGCLTAVFKTIYPKFEVVVVDNNSQDKTREILKNFKKIKIIENKTNSGYAKGNNIGVNKSKGNLIAIINPDTIVTPNWLTELILYIKDKEVAACQPKILLSDDHSLINTTGKITHYLGFDYLSEYKKKNYKTTIKEITSFSGSAFLVKRDIFEVLGGFDEDFFMYYEDGDLSWRIRMLDYKILSAPSSVVYHDYKYYSDKNYLEIKKKFYLLERNRLMMILKNYSLKSLLILSPSIVITELGMVMYFLCHGWYVEKIKEYIEIAFSFNKTINKRKRNAFLRKVSDKSLSATFSGTIDFQEFNNIILKKIANPILSKYWEIAKNFI